MLFLADDRGWMQSAKFSAILENRGDYEVVPYFHFTFRDRWSMHRPPSINSTVDKKIARWDGNDPIQSVRHRNVIKKSA